MISQFQWYRRWRGGRWAKVCGLIFDNVWIRVGPKCLERVDEDYSENDPESQRPPTPNQNPESKP